MDAKALVQSGEVAKLESALKKDPKLAQKAQLVVAAAQAARIGSLEVLLKRGADPNAVWRGYRPLHALIQERPHGETEASKERVRCLKWLLKHGADPELTGAWPQARAILVAAFMGSGPLVDALVDGGARVDVFTSAATGDLAAVRRALKKDPRTAQARDGEGVTVLQCAAASRMGRADAAVARKLLAIGKLLLEAGADPRDTARSWDHDIDAAYLTIGAHNAEMLELLLARGADATEALTSAAWTDAVGLGPIALRHGGDPNRAVSGGKPLLNDLVRWGQFTAALWVLEQGADPNRTDTEGWTALHQAASRGNPRMIQAIVDAGGDPARKDRNGHTPAEVARGKAVLKIAREALRR